ncbi:MAG: hypothetical protein G01um101470_77 [Parcubacteria group bacterium Gr01-1014_70]|nr:MAG: hypothetical protein G01um101470_77 [Parcubacteria group bacterium Gr01-1014_70]
MDENKQQIQNLLDRIENLPPQLKEAMFSPDNTDKMFEIGKRHSLHIDKLGEMAHETGLLMLGVTHPNEFVGNLAERLQVDRATASKIADDINNEIFAPVREHLRALFGPSASSAGPQQASVEQTAPSKSPLPVTVRKLPEKVASLEDLEAELQRAITEEKGIQPLSVVKPSTPPAYSGIDPYREQVGEDMPNIRGKVYSVPSAQNQESRIMNYGEKKQEPQASGFQPPASRSQPTPTPKPVEETSLFSPLPRKQDMNYGKEKVPPSPPFSKGGVPPLDSKFHAPPLRQGFGGQAGSDTYRETIKPEDVAKPKPATTLPKFQGFNMGVPNYSPPPAPPIQPIKPPQPSQTPPQTEKKDPYRETIE